MKNKKISASLRRYYKNKKRNLWIRIIMAWICILIGMGTAGYAVAYHLKYNKIINNTVSVEAIQCLNGKWATDCSLVDISRDGRTVSSLPISPPGDKGDNKSPLVWGIKEKIKNTFPENYKIALAIAECESQLDHKRIGDKHTKYQSTGLFQIRELPQRMKYYNLTTEKLQDPTTNILMARIIYDRFGWNKWSCYTGGYYKKYLKN